MKDVVVVGSPGPLAAWCFHVLGKVLPVLRPDRAPTRLDRFDPPLPGGEDGRLVLSGHPPGWLVAHCAAAGIAPLVIVDDPVACLGFVRQGSDVATLDALRSISASFALIGALAGLPDAQTIRRSDATTLRDLLRPLLHGHEGDTDAAERACGEFGGLDVGLDAAVARWEAGLGIQPPDKAEAKLADDVLGGLALHARSGIPGDVVWPRETFLDGDRPGETAPVVLDAVGRARILFYGPYFHLPGGRWTLRLAIGFSEEIARLPLHVQVESRGLLGEMRIRPERGGIFEAACEIVVAEPEHGIEIRILAEEGAIDGRIALVGATLEPGRA